ncbi:BspA family leucine-rich repeat surface protein [Chryseobacterium vrystaatense]|uniref:BspA family leucine-rich repeat surface protein n=1 Tax=Chryseobacterium vrystaatense TaxID=307480 RepID=UPI00068DB576|nr:BspA family leucine-rich repeat surface protein [Chryseobacterium vrystaatense]
MKLKYLLLSLFLMFCCILKAQNEFITVWKPSNTGFIPSVSTSTQIYFPGVGTDYEIFWEEVGHPAHNGTLNDVTTIVGVPLLIDFGAPLNPIPGNATYTLKVSPENGSFHRICFYGPDLTVRGDVHKLIEVVQWGAIKWSSMQRAFHYCTEMDVTATDLPFLEHVTDMSGIFAGCYKLVGNSSFSNWDVSHVTHMNEGFYSAKLFNQPISSWDISNVTDISAMFFDAGQFNQPIGIWNTSNITNMDGTFGFTHQFNQPLANWNTSNVTNMSGMFMDAKLFNQPIGNWDTSRVKDMSFMFGSTPMFNQPIASWDTSSVTNMRGMFLNSTKFNQPVGNWNTSSVTNMEGVFRESKAFDQAIANWDTSNVTTMNSMFAAAEKFNQPIGNWNTSMVTNMGYMFSRALLFNQPIGSWDISNVTNMYSMFADNPVFNQPLSNWNTAVVTDMRVMFKNAAMFNQDLGSWNLLSALQMNSMLDASGLSCANYNSTLSGWANGSATPNSISIGSSGLVYSSPQAVAARNSLTNSKNWTITNDSYNPECLMLATSEVHKNDLKIYPNPVKNKVFFSKELKDIEIYSIDGQLLKRNSKGNQIDISELPKGVYILKASDQSGNPLSKKIIKD